MPWAWGQVALELVVSGYAFAYAAGLIVGGRLGDHFGHRRMYVLGMAGFGVASLACGLAQGGWVLVGCRLAQGAAAAVMVPQVLALITASYPPAERAHALSWFGVTIGVGAIAGQVVGGLLLQADIAGLGWRPVFLINVPIAIAAGACAGRVLPVGERRGDASIDLPGVVGVVLSLALVLLPLTFGRNEGRPWWCWLMLCLAAVALAITLRIEGRLARRGGMPVLPPVLLREPAVRR